MFCLVKSKGQYFVRFVASNGEEVWRTSETYHNKKDALATIEMLKDGFKAKMKK